MQDWLLFNQLELATQHFRAYETQHRVGNAHGSDCAGG